MLRSQIKAMMRRKPKDIPPTTDIIAWNSVIVLLLFFFKVIIISFLTEIF